LRVTVVECCNWFELPVTVTEYVPADMPGLCGPLLPPPLHATRADATQISNTPNVIAAASFLPDFLAMMVVSINTKSNPSHRTKNGVLGLVGVNSGKIEDGPIVEIVSVEVVEPEPGVTLPDEKEHDESDSCREQFNETGFVNAPKLEPTFIVYEADCPGETLALG